MYQLKKQQNVQAYEKQQKEIDRLEDWKEDEEIELEFE